jgi:hypothetical protein
LNNKFNHEGIAKQDIYECGCERIDQGFAEIGDDSGKKRGEYQKQML